MSSKKFWDLNWYEWNLKVFRIMELQRKRKQDMELLIELERNSMALFANAHRDDKQRPEPYIGSDFYKLTGDPVTDTQVPDEDQGKIQDTIKRLEAVIKRKKRG